MTTKTTQTTNRKAEAAPPASAVPRDPVPEQQPWRTPHDAKGWRTVYRGTGQPRQVRSVLELELTPEQDEWLERAAEAAGLTPHEILGKLIDDARVADAKHTASTQSPA